MVACIRDKDVQGYDEAREEYLKAYGVTILRCSAGEVENKLVEVLERIRDAVGR